MHASANQSLRGSSSEQSSLQIVDVLTTQYTHNFNHIILNKLINTIRLKHASPISRTNKINRLI
jgi:hypothetical protein